MNKRESTRFMKRMVRFCLGFTAAVVAACYVAAWHRVDTGNVLASTCTVFGGELLLTLVLRLLEKPTKGGHADDEYH